ncbi:hypothetical protein [Micromonospora sp. NPDC051296]|uniref:hypothetical protein n=1 Tax=Micromonospora sp. NPDC051296 TaxID=3155046 RepID=UPI00343E5281
MVMEPVPSYEDLIWLFEAEPVYRYADDEREAGYQFDWRELWPYTAMTFRTTRAGYDVEMYIEPGYEVVRLRLRTASDGVELLDLDLRAVQVSGSNGSMVASCYGSISRTTRWLPLCGYG